MHPESLPRGKMDRWGDIAADTVQGFFRQGKNWAQHTADKFKDWLGGKEEKPSGSAPKQENQPQTATLEEWETQDKKFQDEKQPRCNTCLGKMLKSRDIDIPFGVDMNNIINFMEKSDDWKTLPRREDGSLDHSTANKLAQEGETVVATLKNEPTASNPEAHGHGVLLTGNSQMYNSKKWAENVPQVTGSRGTENSDTPESFAYHFQKKDEDNIEYHVHQPGKEKNVQDN